MNIQSWQWLLYISGTVLFSGLWGGNLIRPLLKRAKKMPSVQSTYPPFILWLVGLCAVTYFGLAVTNSIVLMVVYVVCNIESTYGFLLGAVRKLATTSFYIEHKLRGLPTLPYGLAENEIYYRADKLTSAVYETLKHTPVSPDQKRRIREQASKIPGNIAKALQKLQRLRKIKGLSENAGQQIYTPRSESFVYETAGTSDPVNRSPHQDELDEMEQNLIAEMHRSTEILFSIPVSLMRVELAHDDRTVSRILSDLNESNERMGDLAVSHEEMRRL